MTNTLLPSFTADGLRTVVEDVRSVLPHAGCAVPATALAHRGYAEWVAAHGITVIADDADDVLALCRNGIRPVQVVAHCNSDVNLVRRALSAGICRFIADGDESLAAIAEFSHGRAFVHLDVAARLPELPRRIEVVGSYRRVDESDGRTGWSAAVLESLCRSAYLRSCGQHPVRMVLAGDAERMGSATGPHDMAAVASLVDEALVEGCRSWRLSRPAVTLAGVPSNSRAAVAIAPPYLADRTLSAA